MCADLKAMLQEVIGSAHACNVSSRYVKCLRPKKERRELVECLSNYNKAIHAHRSLTHKEIIIHGGWKTKKKKTMKGNEEFDKCSRVLTMTSLVFARLRVAYLTVTLNPRGNFAPISQSVTLLNATRWTLILKFTTSPSSKFLLLPRKCTGPTLLE